VIDPSEPIMLSVDSRPLRVTKEGQQAMIAVSLKNENQTNVSFLTIIEVRQSSGITEQLSWQSSDLQAGGVTEVGVSWIPQQQGTYELGAFSISGFEEGRILSPARTSQVLVR